MVRAPVHVGQVYSDLPRLESIISLLYYIERTLIGMSLLKGCIIWGREFDAYFANHDHQRLVQAMRESSKVSDLSGINVPKVISNLKLSDSSEIKKFEEIINEAISSAENLSETDGQSYLDVMRNIAWILNGYKEIGRFMAWFTEEPRGVTETEIRLRSLVERISSYMRDSIMLYSTEEELLKRLEQEGKESYSIRTSIPDIDRVIGGFSPGTLNIIGGRPGMGKTSIAVSMANKALEEGKTVLFVTLEMSSADIILRMLSQKAKISLWRLKRNGRKAIPSHAEEVLSFLLKAVRDHRLILSERARTEADVLHLVNVFKPDVVFIDYLQLCSPSQPMFEYRGRRDLEIGLLTKSFKRMAMDKGIVFVVMSQLNRKVEDRVVKQPTLADLRESGNIEQDADIVMFVSRKRPEEGDQQNGGNVLAPPVFEGEIIVAKNRNGPICYAPVYFIGDYAAYVGRQDPEIQEYLSKMGYNEGEKDDKQQEKGRKNKTKRIA